jgi:S-disulfanyl-L-cysteine oxidoreductase SoxD
MSTRGPSGLTLQRHWQLMGALEAVNGMLVFGVSTAYLFTSGQVYIFAEDGDAQRTCRAGAQDQQRVRRNLSNAREFIDREELAVSRISLILISGICALVGASFAKAQQTSQATTGWFQQAQAEQGHQLYNNYCAECHRPDLSGALGPALKGSAFLNKWTGKPLMFLYHFEHSKMPANSPDSLPDADYITITAYILQQNGYAAGSEPLNRVMIGRTLPKP